jgi:hypothetical protein
MGRAFLSVSLLSKSRLPRDRELLRVITTKPNAVLDDFRNGTTPRARANWRISTEFTVGAMLDDDRAREIAMLENAKETAELELSAVRQTGATRKPSRLEQNRREQVGQLLQSFTEDEKQLLVYLLHHGETDPKVLQRTLAVSTEVLGAASIKARNSSLLIDIPRTRYSPGRWNINPDLKSALEFHLLGE